MQRQRITSPSNPRVKQAARLRVHRDRLKAGRTLIDGARELSRAIHSGLPLVEVYVCPQLCVSGESQEVVGLAAAKGIPIIDVTPRVFARLAFGERAEGVVGVAETPQRSLEDLTLPEVPLLAVLAGLEKPGNVGAILRTADAVGISAVIAADERTDLYNPNVIRASIGTLFATQVCAAPAADLRAWLRGRSIQVVAARVDADRVYTQIDYRLPTAIVLGSEAEGLSRDWAVSDVVGARVPMRGVSDSLNVSATAAVLFYEAMRQREWR